MTEEEFRKLRVCDVVKLFLWGREFPAMVTRLKPQTERAYNKHMITVLSLTDHPQTIHIEARDVVEKGSNLLGRNWFGDH